MTKISKLLFTFFSRFSKREKFILFGASLFILLAILDRLILGPILSKIKLLNEEIDNQEKIIRQSLHILAQKDRITKEINLFNSYVTSAQSEEEETIFLLKEIEELANKASVYVIDIKSAGIKEEGALKKYLVRLNCEAQLEQLIEFLYNIESSNKLLKIESYDIRPKTAGSSVLRCATNISKALM